MEKEKVFKIFKIKAEKLIKNVGLKQNLCIARPSGNKSEYVYVLYISKDVLELATRKDKKLVSLKLNFKNNEFTVNNQLSNMLYLKDFAKQFRSVLEDVKNGDALFYESRKLI